MITLAPKQQSNLRTNRRSQIAEIQKPEKTCFLEPRQNTVVVLDVIS